MKKGRAPRNKLAHSPPCIFLGEMVERKILKIFQRECKNPVVTIHKCAVHEFCVPYDMRPYPGYKFCKRCNSFNDGTPRVATTWCSFIKKGHGKCQCTSCGRLINHTTGNIKVRCK